eukprot:scaffold20013_cov31-Tisochrysis_lutea.AAC.3
MERREPRSVRQVKRAGGGVERGGAAKQGSEDAHIAHRSRHADGSPLLIVTREECLRRGEQSSRDGAPVLARDRLVYRERHTLLVTHLRGSRDLAQPRRSGGGASAEMRQREAHPPNRRTERRRLGVEERGGQGRKYNYSTTTSRW